MSARAGIASLVQWFGPRRQEVQDTRPVTNILPPELVEIIRAARVTYSPRPDAEGNHIVYVRAPGLGKWRWKDLEHAADKVAAIFFELTPTQCFRAAQLIEAAVTDAAVRSMCREESRKSWIWDW